MLEFDSEKVALSEEGRVPVPRVSVVMACYNAERYIADAINSIRNQSFGDFEFIIVNDGSTDGTLRIIEKIAREDSRIRIIRSERNQGISATVNRGLREARAEWVALMDDDDISYPDRLEKQLDYLGREKNVVCVGAFPLMVDDRRNPITVLDIYQEHHEDIERQLLAGHGWAFLAPTALLRRDVALKVGGYREGLRTSRDLDLFLKIGEVGKLANVPEVLYEYRVHAKSVTHAKKMGQVEQHNLVLREAYKRRNLQGPVPQELAVTDQVRPTDHHLKWGWWALGSGYPKTAQRQGLLALTQQPMRVEGWKLLACAFRDRFVRWRASAE